MRTGRHPAIATTVAALLIVVMIAGAAAAFVVITTYLPRQSTSQQEGIGPAMILYSSGAQLVEGSPSYFTVGAPIKITFYVVDDRVSNLSVKSATSCLGDYTILQGAGTTGPVIYDSGKHAGCAGNPLDVRLNPGQSYNQTVTWNQTDDAGVQVPPGQYEVMETDVENPQNFSNPVGVAYIGTPVSPADSAAVRQHFYYEGDLSNGYVLPGRSVQIVWSLTNNGEQTYSLQTSGCSYSYKVLDLTGKLVYNSSAHSICNSVLRNNTLPLMDSVSSRAYWNQTEDSGQAVGQGFYRVLIDMHVWSGGHEFSFTTDSDLYITTDFNPTGEQISVRSSSICASHCDSSPYLQSAVDTNGDLKSLSMYLNGTLVGTRDYNLTGSSATSEVTFDTPIDNGTIPIVPGVSYDLVFVGTFEDGNTSISWANPLNPTMQ